MKKKTLNVPEEEIRIRKEQEECPDIRAAHGHHLRRRGNPSGDRPGSDVLPEPVPSFALISHVFK